MEMQTGVDELLHAKFLYSETAKGSSAEYPFVRATRLLDRDAGASCTQMHFASEAVII
jgi:hypothetical protein